jgi:hypothetical protein
MRLYELETVMSGRSLVLDLVAEDVRMVAPAGAPGGPVIWKKPLRPKRRLTATVVVEAEGLLQETLLADRAGEETKGAEVRIDLVRRWPMVRLWETYCCNNSLLVFISRLVDDFGYLVKLSFANPFEGGAQRFVFPTLCVEVDSYLTREAHPAIVRCASTEDREDLFPPQLGRQSAEVIYLGFGESERSADVILDRQDPRGVARLDGND